MTTYSKNLTTTTPRIFHIEKEKVYEHIINMNILYSAKKLIAMFTMNTIKNTTSTTFATNTCCEWLLCYWVNTVINTTSNNTNNTHCCQALLLDVMHDDHEPPIGGIWVIVLVVILPVIPVVVVVVIVVVIVVCMNIGVSLMTVTRMWVNFQESFFSYFHVFFIF